MRGDYSGMGDRGEHVQFQQQNLKGRDNLCYLRIDKNIILKQVSQKWHVNVNSRYRTEPKGGLMSTPWQNIKASEVRTSLTSWETTSFSQTIMLHVVIIFKTRLSSRSSTDKQWLWQWVIKHFFVEEAFKFTQNTRNIYILFSKLNTARWYSQVLLEVSVFK